MPREGGDPYEGTDLRDQAIELVGTMVEGLVRAYADEKLGHGEWNLRGFPWK